jgi:hypothetical protein
MILSEKSATFPDHALGLILRMILSEKSATFPGHALGAAPAPNAEYRALPGQPQAAYRQRPPDTMLSERWMETATKSAIKKFNKAWRP